MKSLPSNPFLTKDFSPPGGGIDFIGLRYVNLYLVGNYLIPEINNVTRDMGMFFWGAWVPWKFQSLCAKNKEKDFTAKNYRIFREKVETALSQAMKISPCVEKYGQIRNKVGATQQCELPCELTFKNVKRSNQNSLYAAAIYGPSLKYLNFVITYRTLAQDGVALDIAQSENDDHTNLILQIMDDSLKNASAYNKLASLGIASFTQEEIEELGSHGLDPSFFRDKSFNKIHNCFKSKLLPDEPTNPGYSRTLTAQLILETLKQAKSINAEAIRNVWYTSHFEDGTALELNNDKLKTIRSYWALFMARQHQRYAIELFLWCFEVALQEGCNSIDNIVDYWLKKTSVQGVTSHDSFRKVMNKLAGTLMVKNDDVITSENWNEKVVNGDERFEYVINPKDDNAYIHGLQMLAGVYWRVRCWQEQDDLKDLMSIGGADRMSINWLVKWLQQRQNLKIDDFLKEIFSDLIFAQHTRIALSRFDGKSQRLRFVLSDNGIEPTISAKSNLGKVGLPWMPDRLDALIDLLCDCSVLKENSENKLEILQGL